MAKHPSKDETAKVIGANHFRAKREVRDQDPLEPTPMRLDINHVDPYDRNPRRAMNPLYHDIRESLKSSGQDEVLTITRRPGMSNYMIMRGGNTRLAIMKALFVEGDLRFAQIDCLFKPWTSDADCIVKHLTENTTQGEMTFIDKARGYRAFQREYEQQHSVELSLRKLAELLQTKGVNIAHQRLAIMNYALDVLEPAMPIPLEEGIGRPQVEKLQKLEHAFRHLAQSHTLYGDDNFEARFEADWHFVLAEYNGSDWFFEGPMVEIVTLMMDRTGAFRDRLMVDIDECLKARKPYDVDLWSTNLGDFPEDEEDNTSPGTATGAGLRQTSHTPADPTPVQRQPADPGRTNNTTNDPGAAATGDNNAPTSQTASRSAPATPPDDIVAQRHYLHVLAVQFAEAAGCADWVEQWDCGYGFFLQVPDTTLPPITGDMGDEHRPLLGWWSLWQHQGLMMPTVLSGMLDAMPDGTIKGAYQRFVQTLNDGATSPTKASASFYTALGGPMFPHVLAQADTVLGPQAMSLLAELISEKAKVTTTLAQQGIDVWTEQ